MKKKVGWTIGALAAAFLTASAVIGSAFDITDKMDAVIVTEAEATELHQDMMLAEEQVQQTQAGFNAYTLKQLMYQEVQVLELQIKVETDPDRLEVLKMTLDAKQNFIRELEEEERRQLLRRGEG